MTLWTAYPTAIDTNVLVFAQREDMNKHADALALTRRLSEGDTPWAISVFCIGEFLRVVTHRNLFVPPTLLEDALASIESLLQSPSVQLLTPGNRYWSILNRVLRQAGATGNLVFDAQIVAVCLEHGFQTIVSEDADMRRFEGIEAVHIR